VHASFISGFFFLSLSASFGGSGYGFFLSGDLYLGGGLRSAGSSIFLIGYF